jgi:micrococcal nuclease
MRYLGLGLLVLVLLVVSACADTSEEGGAAGTATLVPSADTPGPRGTPAASESPTVIATPVTGEQAQVTRVVDGDTIQVSMAGAIYKVRYIGIDTPETVDPRRPVECYGHEASERNRQLVEGKTVELEKDVSETDKYGRLLRYVWVDGEMVNATLVREGYAIASTYPPDVKYQELFASLQREAIAADRGLWGPSCNASTSLANAQTEAFSRSG